MAQSPTTTSISTSTTTKSDPRVAQDADTPLQRSARGEPHGSEERDHEHEFTRAEWERPIHTRIGEPHYWRATQPGLRAYLAECEARELDRLEREQEAYLEGYAA